MSGMLKNGSHFGHSLLIHDLVVLPNGEEHLIATDFAFGDRTPSTFFIPTKSLRWNHWKAAYLEH